jgi:hypothetical protein
VKLDPSGRNLHEKEEVVVRRHPSVHVPVNDTIDSREDWIDELVKDLQDHDSSGNMTQQEWDGGPEPGELSELPDWIRY